jgi:hypothetical protein
MKFKKLVAMVFHVRDANKSIHNQQHAKDEAKILQQKMEMMNGSHKQK